MISTILHSRVFKAVSAQVTEEEGKLQKLRIQLAKRNRDIAALQRKIDNIPTRGELAQYQQVCHLSSINPSHIDIPLIPSPRSASWI